MFHVNLIKGILAIVLLALPLAVSAVKKTDFAYGYSLEVDGDGAVYTLDLNETIYHGMISGEHADLRIFNSRGETVPHYIRPVKQSALQTSTINEVDFYPLYRHHSSAQLEDAFAVYVTTDDKGAIIDINYGNNEPENRKLTGYILDASRFEHPISKLKFGWSNQHQDFVIPVDVDGSQDMKTWRRIVSGHILSHIQHDEHSLLRDEIELASESDRYFRVSWQEQMPIVLQTVKASKSVINSDEPRQWNYFESWNRDQTQKIIYFDTGSVLPADRLVIRNTRPGTLVKVSIESAPHSDGPWQAHYTGTLFDLQVGKQRITNLPIHLDFIKDRYWRVRPTEEEKLDGAIQLGLGWLPEQLLFIAKGEAPFTLAFGSAQVVTANHSLPQFKLDQETLRQQGKLIKSAQLGAVVQLGSKARLQSTQQSPDWKQFVYWLVLSLGILFVGVLLYRCYRVMENHCSTK